MRMQSPIFPDQVVIVTGAGRGIGRHIALALAREGAKVVVTDSGHDHEGSSGDSTVANRVVEEILNASGDAIAYTGSVLDPTGAGALIDIAVERYGRVDALIHGADARVTTSVSDTSDEAWQRMMDTHLSSAFFLARAFVHHVTRKGSGGRIVNVLPVPPVVTQGAPTGALASSMGLTGLTLAIAKEFEGKGVTANAVAIVSPEGQQAVPTEQVVSLVLYLAADDGKETTGEVFGVDGQHLFAYKTNTTPGVKKYGANPWTPSQVYYRMADIKKVPVPRKPPNPALKSSGASHPVPATPIEKPAAKPKPRRKSTPIEDEPFLPPGPGATSSDPVERTFGLIPLGFRQSKAAGKSFHIYFDITDGPGHTVRLENGEFSVHKGKVGEPRCVVAGPADVVVGMFMGTINAEKAFVSGKLTTTNLAELMALGMVLDPRKAKLAFKKGLVPEPKPAQAPQAPDKSVEPPETPAASSPADKVSSPIAVALARLPDALIPERAAGKSFNIYFDLKDAPPHSLILEDGALRVEAGKVGTPTCIVRTDAETIAGVFTGTIKAEAAFMQGRFSATNLTDMMTLSQVVSIKKAMAAAKAADQPAQQPAEKKDAPDKTAEASTKGVPGPIAAALGRLPGALIPEKATDKSFNIYFELKDAPPHSLILQDGALRVEAGKVGSPTCIVRTDAETIAGVFSGTIKAEVAFMQGRFNATNLTDMMTLNQVLDFKRLR